MEPNGIVIKGSSFRCKECKKVNNINFIVDLSGEMRTVANLCPHEEKYKTGVIHPLDAMNFLRVRQGELVQSCQGLSKRMVAGVMDELKAVNNAFLRIKEKNPEQAVVVVNFFKNRTRIAAAQ